jgi:hypothetical protein
MMDADREIIKTRIDKVDNNDSLYEIMRVVENAYETVNSILAKHNGCEIPMHWTKRRGKENLVLFRYWITRAAYKKLKELNPLLEV